MKSKIIEYVEYKGRTGYWAQCPLCHGEGQLFAEYIEGYARFEPCAEWCVDGEFFINEDPEEDE